MFGKIQLVEFKEDFDERQKAASAWTALTGLVGASYKQLKYIGTQPVNGILHWFIAEQTLIIARPERRVVKLAVLEKDGKFELVRDSIEVIFG
ncbi:MAG: hypothetical protein IJT73_10755 [Selenomonadaceae bacterium]|nr:hypothetical protein [Selenomonadaceae bacterium]